MDARGLSNSDFLSMFLIFLNSNSSYTFCTPILFEICLIRRDFSFYVCIASVSRKSSARIRHDQLTTRKSYKRSWH